MLLMYVHMFYNVPRVLRGFFILHFIVSGSVFAWVLAFG